MTKKKYVIQDCCDSALGGDGYGFFLRHVRTEDWTNECYEPNFTGNHYKDGLEETDTIDLDSFEPDAIFSTEEEAQSVIDLLITDLRNEGIPDDEIVFEINEVVLRTVKYYELIS